MSTPIAGELRPEVIEAFRQKNFSTPVIGVTGGKGGVGKTTVAVNLACALADRGRRVALIDGDVDAPNAAILLSMTLENPVAVSITKPLIDDTLCNACGECVKACRSHALFLPRGKPPLLLGECNGCEACLLVCQANAITRGSRPVGDTYKTETATSPFLPALLFPDLKRVPL